MNRPVTSMLPMNLTPTREFITSDPGKLTYFARANAVRAGTFNAWGALGGLAEAAPPIGTADASTVKAAGALQTVGDLLGNLGRGLFGAAPPPAVMPPPPSEPSPVPYLLIGAGALALGGFAMWKFMK